MNKKTMKDINRFAAELTNDLGVTVKLAGFMSLLKLLYKQKIKPRTVILLIVAYRLNNGKVNEEIYNTFRNSFKRVLEINEQLEEKEEKCMGFDIN